MKSLSRHFCMSDWTTEIRSPSLPPSAVFKNRDTQINLVSYLWIYSHICEFTLISMNLFSYVNLLSYLWIYSNICEFILISVNLFSYLWIYSHMCQFTLICVYQLSYLSIQSHIFQFTLISVDGVKRRLFKTSIYHCKLHIALWKVVALLY